MAKNNTASNQLTYLYYPSAEYKHTLLSFLENRFKYYAAKDWRLKIEAGQVTVDNQHVAPDFMLLARHQIQYFPSEQEPEVDRFFCLLYEDDYYIAVSKSSNIPTSPSGRYRKNCLTNIVAEHYGYEWLNAGHRLDRETSGVNILAKSSLAAQKFGELIMNRKVKKSYWAIMRGVVPWRRIQVRAKIGVATNSIVRIRQAAGIEDGRSSITNFRVLACLPQATLVEAIPLTGRTHQIRVHAEYIKHPIYNDKLYGNSDECFIQWLQDNQPTLPHLLHSFSLSFIHPFTNKNIYIKDTPIDMVKQYLQQIK